LFTSGTEEFLFWSDCLSVTFYKYPTSYQRRVELYDLVFYPYAVTAFFEQVGFLVEKKFVDLDVVDDRLGSHIISNWKKLEPWIMTLRKEKCGETFGEHFQNLYQKTIKYMIAAFANKKYF